MNSMNFFNGFRFNIIKYDKYHLTDNTKTPVPYHFFACLIKGTAKIETNDIVLNLKPGEIFYIPKGLKYRSQWFGEEGDKVEFYSLGFELSPINKTFSLQKINCSDKAREVFCELCKDVPFKEKGIGKLYYFFEQVYDSMQLSEKNFPNQLLEKAIEYTTNNPNAKITEIATQCHISESGIYLLFKKQMGKTPNDIRHKILCDKAKTMLSTTNKSVQEISDALGFSSTSYFRKFLKAHTGKTPREIRKEAGNIYKA